jgi:N-acetylmuramoyl-L-alanine amidase
MGDCILERNQRGRSKRLAGLFLAASLCFGAGTKAAPGKVTAVRFWSLGDVTRIAIEVSSDFHYKSERLENPDRLFFDIHGARPAMVSKGMHVIQVGDALLKQIRVAETTPGVTRVVLDLEGRAEFTASQLANPDRLMIELKLKDKPAPPVTTSVTGGRRIEDAPAGAVTADITSPTVVVASRTESAPVPDTPKEIVKVPLKRFEPPPYIPDPPRPAPAPELLSQPPDSLASKPARALPPYVPPTTFARNTAPPPPSLTPAPVSLTPVKDPPKTTAVSIAEPAPAKSNANGERSLTRVLGLKLGRVVIDPGHGGNDVGTHGASGVFEKDITLDVARRLGALLEERLSSEVIYTRSDDTYIALEQRTQIANDHKADLFLSIHVNSSPYHYVAGVETYYLNFTTSKAAMDVAARENASSERSVFDLKDLLQKIALKDKIDESREFATRIESSLYGLSSKANPAGKNRGVKRAPFVVLIGASMPSVLAEIGFLTNMNDEALLKKPEHRQKIAEALYKGIANYAETLSHFQVAKRD